MEVLAALVPPVVTATAFITIAIMVYRYTLRAEAAEDQPEQPEQPVEGSEEAQGEGPERAAPRNGDSAS